MSPFAPSDLPEINWEVSYTPPCRCAVVSILFVSLCRSRDELIHLQMQRIAYTVDFGMSTQNTEAQSYLSTGETRLLR
jgi:hypothetical protein